MNQTHRSSSSSPQRICNLHPEGLTTRLAPVEVGSSSKSLMSARPSTTDIHQRSGYVSFVPQADIAALHSINLSVLEQGRSEAGSDLAPWQSLSWWRVCIEGTGRGGLVCAPPASARRPIDPLHQVKRG